MTKKIVIGVNFIIVAQKKENLSPRWFSAKSKLFNYKMEVFLFLKIILVKRISLESLNLYMKI